MRTFKCLQIKKKKNFPWGLFLSSHCFILYEMNNIEFWPLYLWRWKLYLMRQWIYELCKHLPKNVLKFWVWMIDLSAVLRSDITHMADRIIKKKNTCFNFACVSSVRWRKYLLFNLPLIRYYLKMTWQIKFYTISHIILSLPVLFAPNLKCWYLIFHQYWMSNFLLLTLSLSQ